MEHNHSLGTLAANVIRDFGLLGAGVTEMAKSEASHQTKVAARRVGFAVFGILLGVQGVVAIFYAIAAALSAQSFSEARVHALAAVLALATAGLCGWLAARKASKGVGHTSAIRLSTKPAGERPVA